MGAFDNIFSKTTGGAGLGAGIGGPWGALIGGAGGLGYGILDEIFGGGGGGQPMPSGYIPDAAAFGSQATNPYGYFGTGGQGDFYLDQYGYALAAPGVPQTARNAGLMDESVREKEAMGWLSQLASGQDSMARREGALQQQQLSADLMSQAATASQGRYNPALQRQAMLQRSQLGSQMAGQTALNAAKEQMAARQAYAQAVGQQQQNRALWNSVAQGAYNAQTGRMGTQNQMRSGWMQMALDQAERDRASKMALEAMRLQAGEGQANREFQNYMTQQEAARQAQQQQNQAWMSMGSAGLADWSRRGGSSSSNNNQQGWRAPEDQGFDEVNKVNRNW